VIRLLAANCGSNCSLTQAINGCIVCYGISLVHANQLPLLEKCAHLIGMTHVRSAIASYRTFTFTFEICSHGTQKVSQISQIQHNKIGTMIDYLAMLAHSQLIARV